jgi:hypothetical protein
MPVAPTAQPITLKKTFVSVSYTPSEEAIYQFIRAKPNCFALSSEVIAMIYGGKRPPINARIIVGGMLNTLKKKMDRNRAPMILKKSKRRGPHPIGWYLQPRVLRDSTIDRVVRLYGVDAILRGCDRATAPPATQSGNGAGNSPHVV